MAKEKGKVRNKAGEGDKLNFVNSIKMKIVLLVFLAAIASAGISLIVTVVNVRGTVTGLIRSYMNDMARLAGETIDNEIDLAVQNGGEAGNILSPENLDKELGDINIDGMDSSYAYLVGADGMMLYHPTADKIGQPVENAAVKQLLGEIGAGNRPETDVIIYEFKGAMKYASYYIGKNKDFILVVTADEDEALSSLHRLVGICVAACVITLLICCAVTVYIAMMIVKPVEQTTEIVSNLANLDFRTNETIQKISKRKDETGVMAKAIESLRKVLVSMVKQIASQSDSLYSSSSDMSNSAGETAVSVEQVERAISDIAKGATAQAQETQTATENVIVMGNMIEATNDEVENLRDIARTMRDAGNKAMEILAELNAINQKTGDAMEVIYQQTNTTNESAMKIKEATDMITDIAEETNLLSLNASIEAARAGEQGRGFAVVAGQIQKLAEQSNESARQIAEIINLLISDSEKTVETMEDVKEVIRQQTEKVSSTETAFTDVKNGIDKSIDGIRSIAKKTAELDQARVKVVDVVQNLTSIAEENAASTEETSASAAAVTNIMDTISGNAKSLNQIADELHGSVKNFITE